MPLVQFLNQPDMLILRVLYFAHLLVLVFNKRAAGSECFTSKTAAEFFYSFKEYFTHPYTFGSLSTRKCFNIL